MGAWWLTVVVGAAVTGYAEGSDGEQYIDPTWAQWLVICCLLLLGGVFSGLSLGLMQLDPNRLRIVGKSGTEAQKKWARMIYPIRKNGNYLLCVLLVGNVLTNNTLAILLEQLTDGVTSIIGATASITVFGEIIPQAICGRNPLWTGYWTIPITWFFYVILSPVAYPVSLLLNFLLGEEIGVYYLRDELSELLRLTQQHSDIDRDELGILSGALSMKSTIVEEVMTPIDRVIMVDGNTDLTREKILSLSGPQYSRLPVFMDQRDNVVGLLLAHDLVPVAASVDETVPKVRDVMFPISPRRLPPTTPIHTALNEFKGSECHILFVVNSSNRIIGMITKNDLVEQLLQMRFPDERLVRRESPDALRRHKVPSGLYTAADSQIEEESVTRPLLADAGSQSPSRVSYSNFDDGNNA
eukprot:m.76439 g.76439  ORF g.76439 m.76439 type:complete len:412 (+) comp10529_c0_seq1:31-1266(+)